jgi:mono/diheme cytochrome c family protein
LFKINILIKILTVLKSKILQSFILKSIILKQMMNRRLLSVLGIMGLLMFLFEACSPAKGNHPGHEYMPDMGHSIAFEANKIDGYSLNTWDDKSTKTLVQLWGTPRLPVQGTIPRGYVGVAGGDNDILMNEMRGAGNGIATPINGNVPYYYADTEEERTRANREIVGNPYPITKTGLAKGKELYNIYCGVCHGANANGNGYLVSDENPNAKYPAQPANLLLDTFVNGNNGRLYHAIMYGKNVMGGYADKLSYEERWQVIHYIRACQAAEKKLEYSDRQNTLSPRSAITDSAYMAQVAARTSQKATKTTEAKKTEGGTSQGTEQHSGATSSHEGH